MVRQIKFREDVSLFALAQKGKTNAFSLFSPVVCVGGGYHTCLKLPVYY